MQPLQQQPPPGQGCVRAWLEGCVYVHVCDGSIEPLSMGSKQTDTLDQPRTGRRPRTASSSQASGPSGV